MRRGKEYFSKEQQTHGEGITQGDEIEMSISMKTKMKNICETCIETFPFISKAKLQWLSVTLRSILMDTFILHTLSLFGLIASAIQRIFQSEVQKKNFLLNILHVIIPSTRTYRYMKDTHMRCNFCQNINFHLKIFGFSHPYSRMSTN